MAQDLFSYIKQKALNAANAVGSFVTQNPTPNGFIANQVQQRLPQVQQPSFNLQDVISGVLQKANNAIPGGFSGGMQRVQESFKQPDQYDFYRQIAQNKVPTLSQPLEKAMKYPSEWASNWVMNPIVNIPKNIQTVVDPNKELLDRVLAGVQTAGAVFPGDELIWSTANAAKALAAKKDVAKAFSGEEMTGLGSAITGGKEGLVSDIGNIAELPLMLAAGAVKGKQTPLTLETILKNAKKDKAGNIIDEGAIKLIDKLANDIKGTNVPSPITYAKPKGSAQPSFLGSEKGLIPVREMTTAETKAIPKTVIPPSNVGDQMKLLTAGTEANPLLKYPDVMVQGTPKGFLRKLWDREVLPSKKVIEGAGPSGKKISTLLTQADEEGSRAGGTQADQLVNAFKALTRQEKATFADVVEGRMRPASQAQLQAVRVWNTISGDIYNRAKSVGLDIGKIENYFPHNVLIDTKNPEARMMLSRSAQRRYGNLEMARQSDLPYDKDPSVLLDYIYSANNRIADAKYFGADDRVLYNLANQTAKEGGDTGQVTQYLDQILRKNQSGELDKLSQGVRGVQTVLKLNPLTSVTNLTQNLSTALRTDIPTTARAISNAVADPTTAISNARKAGEIDAEMARALESFAGQGQGVTKWLRAIGMLGTEKVNRVIAVNAGMEYVAKLNKQAMEGSEAAVRELTRLGLKPGKSIDSILGGKRISGATQFSTKEGELPYGWQTAIGKVLTQFKSFSYKQTGLLINEAKRIGVEAKNGNFKPLVNALATYGVAAPIVGEVVNDIRSLFQNKKRQDTGSL